jgi:hypothetical protein
MVLAPAPPLRISPLAATSRARSKDDRRDARHASTPFRLPRRDRRGD